MDVEIVEINSDGDIAGKSIRCPPMKNLFKLLNNINP